MTVVYSSDQPQDRDWDNAEGCGGDCWFCYGDDWDDEEVDGSWGEEAAYP